MERITLIQHLRRRQNMAEGATGEFTSLMMEIMVGAKFVSLEVNNAGLGENILGLTGRVNIQGEEVQKLDEYANEIFIKLLGNSGLICAITSEELDKPVIIPPDQAGKYVFTMDPLDGSSNIDVNVSIGTIFSIYRKQSPGKEVTDEDLLQKGSQQVASGYILYGSSTMFVYTSGEGVHGFTLDPSLGEFFLSHGDIKIPQSGTTYSINEGNIETWEEPQKSLVDYMKETDKETQRPYKLRYIGTLVSDFHRTLLKGGIFMYPGDQKNPRGKLRYAFEAAPLAFIVEQAGGKATDGQTNIQEIKPSEIHQRTPLFIGSSREVDLASKFLKT
ncbi:MAG: class 1 fructose-bisphosphatase [Nitrospinota bacterium]|nr:class 1 fructose-bisphosphatase [Nitrospinota bacterium]